MGVFAEMQPIEPDLFARQAIAAVLRDVAVIVIPRWWKLMSWFERLAPGAFLRYATRAFSDVRRDMNVKPMAKRGPAGAESRPALGAQDAARGGSAEQARDQGSSLGG